MVLQCPRQHVSGPHHPASRPISQQTDLLTSRIAAGTQAHLKKPLSILLYDTVFLIVGRNDSRVLQLWIKKCFFAGIYPSQGRQCRRPSVQVTDYLDSTSVMHFVKPLASDCNCNHGQRALSVHGRIEGHGLGLVAVDAAYRGQALSLVASARALRERTAQVAAGNKTWLLKTLINHLLTRL